MSDAKPAQRGRKKRPVNRIAIVGGGLAVGAVWGVVIWVITTLLGQKTGAVWLAYLVITTAMLGGGVAAFFGAQTAQRRGESVAPRMWRRRRS
ncbi:MAG: hypothetical protein U0Y82_00435 [Thermoleophilia bacterium]